MLLCFILYELYKVFLFFYQCFSKYFLKKLLIEIESFFKRLMKNVSHTTIICKKIVVQTAQTVSKHGLTPRKISTSPNTCLLFDEINWKGILFHNHKLLQLGQTIDSIFYCQLLKPLVPAIEVKRPELI